jgi:toxin YoeB
MRLIFSEVAWSDSLFLAEAGPGNSRSCECIDKRHKRSPFNGIGKPEPLGGDLKGFWSRRITQEHRIVYRATGTGEAQAIEIAACRFHYGR